MVGVQRTRYLRPFPRSPPCLIIHFNENAYVKGRTILDAVGTIDDILKYTERENISGLLVAIDFKKKRSIR